MICHNAERRRVFSPSAALQVRSRAQDKKKTRRLKGCGARCNHDSRVSVDLVLSVCLFACLLASLCVKLHIYALNLRVVESPPAAHTRADRLLALGCFSPRFESCTFPGCLFSAASAATMRCRSGRVSYSSVNEKWRHVVCESLRLIVVYHKRKRKMSVVDQSRLKVSDLG